VLVGESEIPLACQFLSNLEIHLIANDLMIGGSTRRPMR